jgi:hypothetical protein
MLFVRGLGAESAQAEAKAFEMREQAKASVATATDQIGELGIQSSSIFRQLDFAATDSLE